MLYIRSVWLLHQSLRLSNIGVDGLVLIHYLLVVVSWLIPHI